MTQYTSHHRRRYARALLAWFAAMDDAYNAMLDGDRKNLERWEQEHLGDGRHGTSDWPGWQRYIGPRPTPPPAAYRSRHRRSRRVR